MNRHVLEHFELGHITGVTPLGGAGGYSGASFWRVDSDLHGTLCLRKWPKGHPSESQLKSMHVMLSAIAANGLPVPAPLAGLNGGTMVRYTGTWWELTPWLKGVANYHLDPTVAKLQSAMTTLARMHQAAAQASASNPILAASGPKPSPALKQRFDLLETVPGWVGRLAPHIDQIWPSIRNAAETVLRFAQAAGPVLERHRDTPSLTMPLQWVVRDIWHDHILFTKDEVTGIVDFGTCSHDTVATDISRLLASLEGDNSGKWEQGLAAYEEVRPLSPNERRAIESLDQSAIVLSGLYWLQWIMVDRRTFPGRENDISIRLEGIAARLLNLASEN